MTMIQEVSGACTREPDIRARHLRSTRNAEERMGAPMETPKAQVGVA